MLIKILNVKPHTVSNLFSKMKAVYRCPRRKMPDDYKDV